MYQQQQPADNDSLEAALDASLSPQDVVLIGQRQWDYLGKRYRMSPREIEVAQLVCRGFTNADVADELEISTGTVKTHLRSIFSKVRAHSRITLLLRFVATVDFMTSTASSSFSKEGPASPKL